MNHKNLGFSGRICLRIVTLALLAAVAACGPPAHRQIDQQLISAETSPIPGAVAKVLPVPGATDAAADANFCVTDAGYCPLAAAVPAGRNCLCQTSQFMYGGKTGVAPQNGNTQ